MKELTPEQRIIDILIHRLGVKPFFAEEIAKDIFKALNAHTANRYKIAREVIGKIFTDYWNDCNSDENEMVNLSELEDYFDNWLDQ